MLAAAPVAALPTFRRALAAEPWSIWTAVPGFGTTIDAPAAVRLGGAGLLYLLVRGPESGIYFNRLDTSGGSEVWSGWREIPGRGRTPSAPAVTPYEDHQGNDLAVFVRDYNNGIAYNRYSSHRDAWTGWSLVPGGGQTPSAPAVAYLGGLLHVFVQDTIGGIQYNRTEPYGDTRWTGWRPVPGGGFTPSAPGAAFGANGGSFALSVVARGFDNLVYENVLDYPSFNWSGFHAIPGGQLTPGSPALVTSSAQAPPPVFVPSFGGRLYYNLRGAPGSVLSGWNEMPGDRVTPSSPAAAEVHNLQGHYRYVFIRGLDNYIYYTYYQI
jgi:hypothetical protein